MLKGSDEHAQAEVCLFTVYPRQRVENAILKSLFDARLAAPTIAQVPELQDALGSLGDDLVFEVLETFEDPCKDILTKDQNQIEAIFQALLSSRQDELRHWVVENIYSKPIYDARAYYDSGLAAAILHEYEGERLAVGMKPLSIQDRTAVLNYITRMVLNLTEEFAKSQFTPPNIPAASHPDVILYLRNLATFPQYRDSEFKKSNTARNAYIQLFSDIEEIRNSIRDAIARQRNWALGGVIVAAGIAIALTLRKPSKTRKIKRDGFTPTQEAFASRKYAGEYPAVIPPAAIPYEEFTDEP